MAHNVTQCNTIENWLKNKLKHDDKHSVEHFLYTLIAFSAVRNVRIFVMKIIIRAKN